MDRESKIVDLLREDEKRGLLKGSFSVSRGESENLEAPVEEMSGDISNEPVDIGEERMFAGDKKLETNFQISEEKYRLIAENTSDLIAIATFSLKPAFTYVSPSYTKILGYHPEEMIGKNGFDFVHPDDQKKLILILKKYLVMRAKKLLVGKEQELVERVEFRIKDKSGNWHYVETTVNIIGNELLFISKDITWKKKIEADIKEKDRSLQNIFDAVAEGISILDKELNILKVNRFMESMYPNSMPLVGKKCYRVYQQRESPCPWCPSLVAMESGKVQTKIVPYPSKEKPERWLSLSSFPMKDTDGNITGVVEYVRDITEQKKREDALEFERKQMLSLFDSIDGLIYVSDPETYEILYVNPTLQKTFNKKLVGETCYKALQNKDAPCEFCTNHIIFKDENKGKPYRWEFHNSVVGRDYIMTDRVITWPDGRNVRFELATDITEQKRMNEELKEAKKHFEMLFNVMVDPVMILDQKGNFLELTDRVKEITGWDKKDLIGKNFLFTKLLTKKSKAICIKNLVKRIGGLKIPPYEVEVLTKDERKLHFEINAQRIMYKEKPADLVVFRDISERKKAEKDLQKAHEKLKELNRDLERKVEERTEQIQRLLKQKDDFINQLGHDLKNPLGPLINLLPLLEKKVVDEKDKEIFTVLQRNVGYMRNLVTKTLELARLNSPNTKFDFKEMNLSDAVKNVIDANQFMFQETHIEVINNIPNNIILNADYLRMEELFNNLLTNAVKYSNDAGTVVIDVVDQPDTVTVSIKDSGIGITAEQLDHVFDEFYKADGSRHDFDSSGLGMPICKRIVEKHGGRIWAESDGLGKGSTFYFTIPKNHVDVQEENAEMVNNDDRDIYNKLDVLLK